MSVHPVTPMAEADLRRHLAAQGLEGVAALHYPDYGRADADLDARLERILDEAPPAVLLDVARSADLATVGRLIWSRARRCPLLAVGPSSVAQALAAHWDEAPFRHRPGRAAARPRRVAGLPDGRQPVAGDAPADRSRRFLQPASGPTPRRCATIPAMQPPC